MHILATSAPSHGAQGVLFLIALVLFVIAAIVAWAVPPILHKAIAAAFVGLAVCALVWTWVQLAAS